MNARRNVPRRRTIQVAVLMNDKGEVLLYRAQGLWTLACIDTETGMASGVVIPPDLGPACRGIFMGFYRKWGRIYADVYLVTGLDTAVCLGGGCWVDPGQVTDWAPGVREALRGSRVLRI